MADRSSSPRRRVKLVAQHGFSLTELGEHRFKDFPEPPIPIYQLGAESFPPLKTISNTNLPRPASSFVGRERELAEVLAKDRGRSTPLDPFRPGWLGKDAARARGGRPPPSSRGTRQASSGLGLPLCETRPSSPRRSRRRLGPGRDSRSTSQSGSCCLSSTTSSR